MPTPSKGPRLGGGPAHERLILSNMATALFEHGRITTTEAKAKRLRPLAERLVTFAKRGDLHARRRVLRVVRDKSVVHNLFAEIGPRYAERPGGYTRITKLGPRKGDNAPMAVIELVESRTVAQEAVDEGERARGTRFARRRPSRAAAAAATTEAPEAAEDSVAVPAEGDVEAPAAEQPAVDEAATEGVSEPTAEAAEEQVAVPTEGGDTEVVTEQAAVPGQDEAEAEAEGPPEEVVNFAAEPAAEPTTEPAAEPGPEVTDAAGTDAAAADTAATDTVATDTAATDTPASDAATTEGSGEEPPAAEGADSAGDAPEG